MRTIRSAVPSSLQVKRASNDLEKANSEVIASSSCESSEVQAFSEYDVTRPFTIFSKIHWFIMSLSAIDSERHLRILCLITTC